MALKTGDINEVQMETSVSPGAAELDALEQRRADQDARTHMMMSNPMVFMQLLGLFLLAFTDPENMDEGMREQLSGLLGFDDVDAMDQWRENAGGSFTKALGSANWSGVDEDRVQQEYHKYAALADSGNPLLELIGQKEAGGDYNKAYGGSNPLINGKPATESTIAEVRQWQREFVAGGSASSAIGKYQIIQKTMDGLIYELAAEDGVSRQEFMADNLFDEAMQDRMAVQLLERRGLDKYVEGSMSERDFLNELSKEWASLPYQNGRSYYDGDGLNASGVDRVTVTAAARVAKDQANGKIPARGTDGDDESVQVADAKAEAEAEAEAEGRTLQGSFVEANAAEEPLEKPADQQVAEVEALADGGQPTTRTEFQTAASGETPAPTDPAQTAETSTPADPAAAQRVAALAVPPPPPAGA